MPLNSKELDLALLKAILDGDMAQVYKLLDQGANVNVASQEGQDKGKSVLWWAVKREQSDIVKYILDKHPDANVNATAQEGEDKGTSVLWWAAYSEQWDIVKQILDMYPDANVNATAQEGENKGKSVLWRAVGFEQWDIVKQMLDMHPEADVNAAAQEGKNKGKSVLWLAANFEQWDIVKQMLDMHPDANVNATAQEGKAKGISVLWWAAYFKQWDIVKQMLGMHPDANVNATAQEGENKGISVLLWAVGFEQWDIVKQMLDMHPDANVNATAQEGQTKGMSVLWWAAYFEQWDIVKQMLDMYPDANVNAMAQEGQSKGISVLWLAAASNKQWDIVKQMLDMYPDANVNATAQEGKAKGISVLWLAAASEQWDIVKQMLDMCPDTNVNATRQEGSDKGISVLWLAVKREQRDIVKHILDKYPDADVNVTPQEGLDKGKSVLWLAAASKQWDIVKQMLDMHPDADVNATAQEGKAKGISVLWLAAMYKAWEIVEQMLIQQPNADRTLVPADETFKNQSVEYLIRAQELHDFTEEGLSKPRQYKGAIYLKESRGILNKITEAFNKMEIPKNCKEDLERASLYAQKAKELKHEDANSLQSDIHYEIIRLYCFAQQPEDAIAHISEYYSEISNSNKGESYFAIANLFLTKIVEPETCEQRFQRLIKSCAFLTEAYSLLSGNSKEQEKVNTILLNTLYTTLSPNHHYQTISFENIKEHPDYAQLMQAIIGAKEKLFCREEESIAAPMDIATFCDFIKKERIITLKASTAFWNSIWSATQNKRKIVDEEAHLANNPKKPKTNHESDNATYNQLLFDDLFKAIETWELHKAIQESLRENHINYSEQLKTLALSLGFRLQDVPPDGKCFFHAVLHQLQNSQCQHLYSQCTTKDLITQAVQYIIDHQNEFAGFIKEDINNFISGLMEGARWADDVSITALSEALKTKMIIINSDGSKPIVKGPLNAEIIIYLGYEVERHYQSLMQDPTLIPSRTLQDYINSFNAKGIDVPSISNSIQQTFMPPPSVNQPISTVIAMNTTQDTPNDNPVTKSI